MRASSLIDAWALYRHPFAHVRPNVFEVVREITQRAASSRR
jgi:hypothetical protein